MLSSNRKSVSVIVKETILDIKPIYSLYVEVNVMLLMLLDLCGGG